MVKGGGGGGVGSREKERLDPRNNLNLERLSQSLPPEWEPTLTEG